MPKRQDRAEARVIGDVGRVHKRVAKELGARFIAEFEACETESEQASVAVGWAQALATAYGAVRVATRMPLGMMLEMVADAAHAAEADEDEVEAET